MVVRRPTERMCGASSFARAERPEALAFIALEFFERRDLFLVAGKAASLFRSSGFATGRLSKPMIIEFY